MGKKRPPIGSKVISEGFHASDYKGATFGHALLFFAWYQDNASMVFASDVLLKRWVACRFKIRPNSL